MKTMKTIKSLGITMLNAADTSEDGEVSIRVLTSGLLPSAQGISIETTRGVEKVKVDGLYMNYHGAEQLRDALDEALECLRHNDPNSNA